MTAKTILNWNERQAPTNLFNEGKIITKPKEIANNLNKYYIEKIDDIRKGISTNNEDPAKKLKQRMSERKCKFKLKEVTENKMKKTIRKLKEKKMQLE